MSSDASTAPAPGGPEQRPSTGVPRWVGPVCAVALPLAVYLAAVSPAVVDGDPADFAVQAHELGLAHPPGYPLVGMLGKVVTTCVPLGSPAWRANLLGPLASGACLALGYALVRCWGVGRVPAVLAMWVLGLSPLYLSQSLHINPYPLTLAFAFAVFLLLEIWSERRGMGMLAAAAGVYGLGMGGHPALVFFLPAVLLFVLLHLRRDGLRRMIAAVPVGLGAAVAGCVPWVAYTLYYLQQSPDAGPGNGILQRFMGTLAASDSPWRFSMYITSILSHEYLRKVALHVGHTVSEVSPVGALLAAVGALALWARRPVSLALVVVGYLATINFEATAITWHTYDVYRLPCQALVVLLLGVGLWEVWRRAAARTRVVLCVVLVVLSVAPAYGILWLLPADGGRLARLLRPMPPLGRRRAAPMNHADGVAALSAAPEGATIWATWGPFCTLRYLQEVEGHGADVRLVCGGGGWPAITGQLADLRKADHPCCYGMLDQRRLYGHVLTACNGQELFRGTLHWLCKLAPSRGPGSDGSRTTGATDAEAGKGEPR